VLAWIQGASNRWKTFVGNRVALIQEATSSATWHHVHTQHNPADLISRGTDPTTLSNSTLGRVVCCVKTVQQITYAQEVTDLLKSQEVSTTSSLKLLHPFIDKEGLIRVGG
jgi:hypothetical protein